MNSFTGGWQPEHVDVQPEPAEPIGPISASAFAEAAADVLGVIESVIRGKSAEARLAFAVMLAEGHLLIEDVPGVGKTMLARALARSVDCSVSRIQFTPDLLPADITGVSIWNQAGADFEFKPGPIFANVVIADEINRATPKTQSALLESMEERQVTVDGTSYPLAAPFIVVATQNPVEMEGTYALPEAQRDRFSARLALGYPDAASELTMIERPDASDALAGLAPAVSVSELHTMIDFVRGVHVSSPVGRYAVALAAATRGDTEVRLGVSPRATLQLVKLAKAHAALDGRDFVLPDDIDALAVPALAHRIIVDPRGSGESPEEVVSRVVREVPVPLGTGS